eukprot:GHUV01011811.1.p1 GENE.GHUV01011811.1~~GHUV01011811.1.p1  ORF type:complete len:151 (-),score=11.37 GHUV01011811.1:1451-1903(-)
MNHVSCPTLPESPTTIKPGRSNAMLLIRDFPAPVVDRQNHVAYQGSSLGKGHVLWLLHHLKIIHFDTFSNSVLSASTGVTALPATPVSPDAILLTDTGLSLVYALLLSGRQPCATSKLQTYGALHDIPTAPVCRSGCCSSCGTGCCRRAC